MNILKSALFKNGIRAGLGANLAIGIGLVMLGPAIASVARSVLRPVAKAAAKSGMIMYDQSRNLLAETMKSAEHTASESRGELSGKGQPMDSASSRVEREAPAVTASGYETSTGYQMSGSHRENKPERPKPWIVRGY